MDNNTAIEENLKNKPTSEELNTRAAWHLRHTLAMSNMKASDHDRYLSFSYALRDSIVDNWMKTQDEYHNAKTRRAYYLSLEFLIGRLLGNNALNMQMYDTCETALKDKPMDWEALQDLEVDAGLGNGGLGRLAACFIDSMATLNLPCMGYGLRYDYGIFRQMIVNGNQVEEPDTWKRDGYPWEIKRSAYTCSVCFGGIAHQIEQNGHMVWKWFPAECVCGVPYDVPVIGYTGKTVNNLRLWSAQADNEFDFQNFNRGAYTEAVGSKINAENLTKVLYPNDNFDEGKELRLRQQYFFVSCTLQDIFRRHLTENPDLSNLPDKVQIQMNDTHPTLVVPEMIRLLVDENGYTFEQALEITRKCTAYTNHTVLPEALEKWSVPLFARLLPRHLHIIYELNMRFLQSVAEAHPGDTGLLSRLSIIEEGQVQRVRMANLAIIGSHAVNGVAAIHSDILKERVFKDFAEMWPEKFQNKTNGITQRRWLMLANRPLADLITSKIGDGWVTDLDQLRKLEDFINDKEFMAAFKAVKRQNKMRLAEIINKQLGIEVNPDSIFDVQVKRLHEYKRQLLMVLYIIILYRRLRANPNMDIVPQTFIFAAKAAPGYMMAKLIIKLIHNVALIVNNDASINGKIKVVFLPDYRVSLAEKIVTAADISEQISLAGLEASGTGNMKLMLNGAITLGTEDGANVEIHQEVGDDNIFIFGMSADEVVQRKNGYSPWEYYNNNPEIRAALEDIRQNFFSPFTPGEFAPVVQSLLDYGDNYMLLADLESYIAAHEKAEATYLDEDAWLRKSLINVARSGKFSSDRTIKEYAKDIWNLEPFC